MTVVFTNVFNNTPLFCLSIGWLILHSVLSIYLVSSLQYPHTIQQITISIRQKAYYPHNIQHITISIRQKVYYPHNIQPRRIQYIPKSSLLIADYNIHIYNRMAIREEKIEIGSSKVPSIFLLSSIVNSTFFVCNINHIDFILSQDNSNSLKKQETQGVRVLIQLCTPYKQINTYIFIQIFFRRRFLQFFSSHIL